MRAILLAGAAVLAVSSFGVTAANAGGLWVAKGVVVGCAYAAYHTGPQTNCGKNIITPGYNPNNKNKQKLSQDNKMVLWKHSKYLKQVNIGVNVINKDDHNKQKIDQNNKIFGGGYGVLQVNVGANVVEDGEWNKQKLEQSNTAKGYNIGLTQANVGLNYVEEGNGNTQKLSQENSAKNTYDTEQVNIGANYVGNGNDNYQEIEQSNSISNNSYLTN